jgi:hypothetical protein
MSVATLASKPQGHGDLLGEDENPFSTNKVTGHSLNFPIIGRAARLRCAARLAISRKGRQRGRPASPSSTGF